jgi:hypothetical protein
LSIVTFLGVLVPGGVFIFLCGPSIRALFPPQGSAQYWVAILVASYVVGQILLAATELLNGVAGYVAWAFPTLAHKIRRDTSHPSSVSMVRPFMRPYLCPTAKCRSRRRDRSSYGGL